MDLERCFETFTSTAFRQEILPAYAASERFSAWRANRPLPPRTPATNPYLGLVLRQTQEGKQRTRARLVSDVLTDYERYELGSYQANAAAGEVIRIGRRSALPALTADFWLFDYDTDSPRVGVMHYGSAGDYLGCNVVSGWRACAEYERQRLLSWAHSASLADFLAEIRNTDAA